AAGDGDRERVACERHHLPLEPERAAGQHRASREARRVGAGEGHRPAVRADDRALRPAELGGGVHEPVTEDDRVAPARPLRRAVGLLHRERDGGDLDRQLLGGGGGSAGEGRQARGEQRSPRPHSHSIVAGGFEVTSRTTRFTAGISFTIRDATSSTRSYGSRAQSAVIASSDVTARIAIGYPYVRESPWTPTERIAGRTQNDCHRSR